jgi:hypothetical protein
MNGRLNINHWMDYKLLEKPPYDSGGESPPTKLLPVVVGEERQDW